MRRDAEVPSGAWPLRSTFHRLFADRPKILEPESAGLSGTSWDRIIISAAGRLEARDAASGAAIWPRSITCEQEPRLLGCAGSRLIFATDRRMFAVSRDTGSTVWTFGEEGPDRPLDDPEWTAAWKTHALTEQRVFAASDHGDVVAIDVATGGVVWRKATAQQIACLAAGKDQLVVGVEAPNRISLLFLDANTGRISSEYGHDEASSIELLAVRRESLVCLLSKSLICLDLARPEMRASVTSPERFIPSTLQSAGDRLVLSPDGKRLACYEKAGLRLAWQSDVIWSRPEERRWVQASGMMVFVAADYELSAFCLGDGRRVWQIRIPKLSRVLPPRLNDQAIIAVAEGEGNETRRFQILAIAQNSGKRLGDDLVTEPLKTLDEVHLRDRSIILTSGQQLIGYGPDH